MIKKGLITAGSGIAGIVLSFPLGWGPCGPATIPGALLCYGGLLAFLIGCVIFAIGLIGKFISRVRKVDEVKHLQS